MIQTRDSIHGNHLQNFNLSYSRSAPACRQTGLPIPPFRPVREYKIKEYFTITPIKRHNLYLQLQFYRYFCTSFREKDIMSTI